MILALILRVSSSRNLFFVDRGNEIAKNIVVFCPLDPRKTAKIKKLSCYPLGMFKGSDHVYHRMHIILFGASPSPEVQDSGSGKQV